MIHRNRVYSRPFESIICFPDITKYTVTVLTVIYNLDLIVFVLITEFELPKSTEIFGNTEIIKLWHSSILSGTTSYDTSFSLKTRKIKY